MKESLLAFSVFVSTFFITHHSIAAQNFIHKVLIPKKVWVPQNFDDNDNLQVILFGSIGNTCLNVLPSLSHIDLENKKIFIAPRILEKTGRECKEFSGPYTKAVELGVVPEGEYEILVEVQKGTFKNARNLKVKPSPPLSESENIYLPVSEATVIEANGELTLYLMGTYSEPCITSESITINYPSITDNTGIVEVLPRMKREKGECTGKAGPFTIPVKIKGIPKEPTLFHIRAYGGQAVNYVYPKY